MPKPKSFRRCKTDDPSWWEDPAFVESAAVRAEYRSQKRRQDFLNDEEAKRQKILEQGKSCPKLHPMLWMKIIPHVVKGSYDTTSAVRNLSNLAGTCNMLRDLIYSQTRMWRKMAKKESRNSTKPAQRLELLPDCGDSWRKLCLRLLPLSSHNCRKICLSTVKSQFGLTPDMLKGHATEVLVQNPYSAQKPDMRLYSLCTIKKLSAILCPDFVPKSKWDVEKATRRHNLSMPFMRPNPNYISHIVSQYPYMPNRNRRTFDGINY